MDYPTYFIIRRLVMALVIFLGLHMIFLKPHIKLSYDLYEKALRVMGVAFLIIPISCFLYTLRNRVDIVPATATAINLTAYYATYVLMGVSFLMLLGRKMQRWMIALAATLILVFPIPMWYSIIRGDDQLINIVLTASYSYFIAAILALSVVILLRRHRIANVIDNYYSDDLMVCVRWVSKSIYLLIGLTATCVTAPMFFAIPTWLRLIFMLYGVLCFFHIYFGFHRMLMKLILAQVRHRYDLSAVANVTRGNDGDVAINKDVRYEIDHKVREWVSDLGFINPNITIMDVAKCINTNRTYLSRYINTEFQCSFRTWITRLRIEHAKILLLTHPEQNIDDIAHETGSASVESFTHIFTRYEHISPSRWRETHDQHDL